MCSWFVSFSVQFSFSVPSASFPSVSPIPQSYLCSVLIRLSCSHSPHRSLSSSSFVSHTGLLTSSYSSLWFRFLKVCAVCMFVIPFGFVLAWCPDNFCLFFVITVNRFFLSSNPMKSASLSPVMTKTTVTGVFYGH